MPKKTLTMWTWSYNAGIDAGSLHNGWAIWSDADRDGAIEMARDESATLFKLTVTVEAVEPISIEEAKAEK